MQHVFILSSRSGSCYYSKESYSGQVNFLKISEIFRLKYNIYFSKKSRFPFYYLKFTVFEEKYISVYSAYVNNRTVPIQGATMHLL